MGKIEEGGRLNMVALERDSGEVRWRAQWMLHELQSMLYGVPSVEATSPFLTYSAGSAVSLSELLFLEGERGCW